MKEVEGGRGQRRQPLFKIPGAASSGGSETKSKDGRTEGKAIKGHPAPRWPQSPLSEGRTDGRNDGGVDDGRRVQNRPYIPQKRLSKGRNERMRRVAFVEGRAAAAASSEWKGIGAQGAQWYCAVSVFLSFRDSDWRLAGERRRAAVGMNIFRFNRHLARSGRQEEEGDIKRCRISPSAKN